MTKRQIINAIKQSIADRGFTITDTLAEHFYLSLQSRPFIMLMGRSNAPMTELVTALAQAIGANRGNGRLQVLPVKPDWMDFSDLFGYVRLSGRFDPGVIIDFVKAAQDNPEKPYILCLEKVLLDRMEYYLNDILRPMEARKEENYESQPLVTEKYFGSDREAAEKYGTLYMPENLYVVCTLNLDETSLPLNQKLIDRIYTLEVTAEDLLSGDKQAAVQAVDADNTFLQPACRGLFQCTDEQLLELCFAEFEAMNRILMKGNAYVGYQIRNDAAVYVSNAVVSDLLTREQAMDQQILQKVLSHVQGNMKSVGPVLRELAEFCQDRYPRASAKIADMIRKGEQDEYTSCWV